MEFKIKDRVIIHDRKLKTNGNSGSIIGIEKTIEGTHIYMVQVEINKTRKVANFLAHQLVKEIKE